MLTNFIDIFNTLEFKAESSSKRFNKESAGLSEIEIISYIEEKMPEYELWRKDLMGHLGSIGRKLELSEKSITKEYIQNSKAHKLFQEAPFVWRIVHRPEGYVGDAEMMKIIYYPDYLGETTWGKMVHKNATEYKACQSVRNRKDFLKNQIKLIANGNILSMAAGPASEISEFLLENPQNYNTFMALDHDINTIRSVGKLNDNFSYGLANAFQFMKGKNRIAFPRSYYYDFAKPTTDFKSLNKYFSFLKYKYTSLKKETFDFVYSAGLFDYLINFNEPDNGAKALTKFLFQLCKPGGKLIIGNFNHSIPDDNYFSMEFLTNWILFYRDDNELMTFIEGIDEKEIKTVEIFKEPEGINSFLVVEKT